MMAKMMLASGGNRLLAPSRPTLNAESGNKGAVDIVQQNQFLCVLP